MRFAQTTRRRSDERGMALVVALLVLLSLTVLGTALMVTVNTESKIVGHQRLDAQALASAEAGVQEAMMRIRMGDVPDNNNKRMVTLIYETVPGSIPVSGTDTTSLPTLQGSNSYLGYSSATKRLAQGSTTDLQVLTVKYKTVKVGPDTLIMKYDDTANPKLNTTTGTNVFSIVATGRRGNASRGIVADVTRARFNILARAAMAARVPIQFKGNIKVCGHDHRADTPTNTEPNACNAGVGSWWMGTVHGSCLPGGWSEGSITEQGSTTVIGEPAPKRENQSGFYDGPWDAIGMNQADFWSFVGPSTNSPPAAPKGIYYLDNNSTPQDQSGSWSFNGGNADGFLYADGDLRINGNFNFRGLIYVEGDLTINGNAWILGGIIVRGKAVVKVANGSAVILYSGEAIQQNISKYGGDIRMIAWREF